MKFVYVASPFKNIDREYAFEIARKACEEVESFDNNFYPVSPVLMWGSLKKEVTKHERHRNLEACKKLLLKCDFIHVADSEYSKSSEGVQIELELAKENGIGKLSIK